MDRMNSMKVSLEGGKKYIHCYYSDFHFKEQEEITHHSKYTKNEKYKNHSDTKSAIYNVLTINAVRLS